MFKGINGLRGDEDYTYTMDDLRTIIRYKDNKDQFLKELFNHDVNLNSKCTVGSDMTESILLNILYDVIFQENTVTVLFGSDELLLQQFKDYYISLPYFLQPGVNTFNNKYIDCNNGSRVVSASNLCGTRGFGFETLAMIDINLDIKDDVIRSLLPVVISRKQYKIYYSHVNDPDLEEMKTHLGERNV